MFVELSSSWPVLVVDSAAGGLAQVVNVAVALQVSLSLNSSFLISPLHDMLYVESLKF